MEGRRRAMMVLPLPGGPINSRLCPPAAATSSARFTWAGPFTSTEVRVESAPYNLAAPTG